MDLLRERRTEPASADSRADCFAADDVSAADDVEQRPLPVGKLEWVTRAACATADPDALFVTGAAQRQAVRLCHGCTVRLECLADALDNRIEHGVWGGMTERERRAVLKRSPEVSSWRGLLEAARAAIPLDKAC